MLEQIIGKKTVSYTEQDFSSCLSAYEKIHIDLGTGDGLFVWRLARQKPDVLAIGLDADRNSLAEGSGRAAKKASRGGCENALFFCVNALELPESFNETAHTVSINFPWGSLLRAIAPGEQAALEKFAGLGKKNALYDFFINLKVFEDEEQRNNMALPVLDEAYLQESLLPLYEKVGLGVINWAFLAPGSDVNVASTWAGRLTRNSKRPTLHIQCRKKS